MPGLPSCRGGDGEHHPSRRADGKEKGVDGVPQPFPGPFLAAGTAAKPEGRKLLAKSQWLPRASGKQPVGPEPCSGPGPGLQV